jgi:hypothetical protein
MLKDIASKKGDARPSGEKPVAHLLVTYKVGERRACSAR